MTPPVRSPAALRRRDCHMTWSAVRHAQVGELGVPAVGERDDVVAFEMARLERLAADLAAPVRKPARYELHDQSVADLHRSDLGR